MDTSTGTSSASASAAPEAPPGPAWLDPAFDSKTLPLRASLFELGSAYVDESGLPINSPSASKTDLTTFVLEEPKDRSSPRVRLLCEDTKARVGLFFDRKDLSTVTRKGAVMAPLAAELASTEKDPTTPGVYFKSGVSVAIEASGDAGVSKLHLASKSLDADGFVTSSLVDQVFEADAPAPAVRSDAELPRGADFFDKPGGKRFARLKAHGPDEPAYLVEKIGAPDKGMVRVRATSPVGTVVGWVSTGALAGVPSGSGQSLTGGGYGTLGGSTVRLEKGTFLTRGDPAVRVGVVMRDFTFVCRSQCKGGFPVVLVEACGAKVELTSEKAVDKRSPKKK